MPASRPLCLRPRGGAFGRSAWRRCSRSVSTCAPLFSSPRTDPLCRRLSPANSWSSSSTWIHAVLRSYSMSGPQGAGTYRISVKRADGAGSHYFHDRIHAGDMLQVSAPRGSFTLAAGDSPVVLLSAGIGATPVLAMLHSLATAAVHARDLVVLRRTQWQRTPICRGSSEASCASSPQPFLHRL